jgi:hypothetical protein
MHAGVLDKRMNMQVLFTRVSRAHLGVTLCCIAATSVVSAYRVITGESESVSTCDLLLGAAIVSLAYPVSVPYSMATSLSDWRNNTRSTFSASFERHVTSNKT